MAACQSGQPISDSNFYSKFVEFVRKMVYVVCASRWEVLDQPLNCMCDCVYLHGQTGGHDSVGTTVFAYSPSTLFDCEISDRSLVTEPSV